VKRAILLAEAAMFDAIFWDNDGVLMASEHLYFQANAEALARAGIVLSLERFAEISLHRGESVLQLAGDDAELRAWRDQRYVELLTSAATVMPGALETVRTLHGRWPMAIVTSCRRAHFQIMHRGSALLDFFDFVLNREDYHHSKPDPEPYLLAAQRAGVEASRCLAIEDSPRGVAAAVAAGMTVAALPGALNAGADFSTARWRLDGLEQLPLLLDGV
jgi:HAD superfamily hydrolase (TIGR01509 family)